jgi:hypothetical protein
MMWHLFFYDSSYLRQKRLHFFTQIVVQHIKSIVKRVSRDISTQLNSSRIVETFPDFQPLISVESLLLI